MRIVLVSLTEFPLWSLCFESPQMLTVSLGPKRLTGREGAEGGGARGEIGGRAAKKC